jgi:hypothetical protein
MTIHTKLSRGMAGRLPPNNVAATYSDRLGRMNKTDLKQSRVVDSFRIPDRHPRMSISVFRYGFLVGAFLIGCTARESTDSKLRLRSVERHEHFYIGMSASEAKKHLPAEAELRELSVAYKYGRKENDPVYVFALPSDQNIGIRLYFNADKRLVEIGVPVED